MTSWPGPSKHPSSDTMLVTISLRMLLLCLVRCGTSLGTVVLFTRSETPTGPNSSVDRRIFSRKFRRQLERAVHGRVKEAVDRHNAAGSERQLVDRAESEPITPRLEEVAGKADLCV